MVTVTTPSRQLWVELRDMRGGLWFEEAGVPGCVGTATLGCPHMIQVARLNLLILIEIEHIEHVTLAVDQQDPPAVDDSFQIVG